MNDFDETPFTEARKDIEQLISKPLQAWMLVPPARRRDKTFAAIMTIPLDLAAAEYALTVTQTEKGWHLELRKQLTPSSRLHLVGEARSYLSALYQLADASEQAIDKLQRTAKRKYKQLQESEVAA